MNSSHRRSGFAVAEFPAAMLVFGLISLSLGLMLAVLSGKVIWFFPLFGGVLLAAAILLLFWPGKKRMVTQPPAVEDPQVDKQVLAFLCPEIRAVLDAEEKAGNKMNGVGFSDWPYPGCVLVVMKDIFVGKPGVAGHAVAIGVHFQHYDYHWIGDSYYCKEHNQIIIAR